MKDETPTGDVRPQSNRVLFCRSAGGVPGLDVHVGIWRALQEAGIRSTANTGCSAGAIIAAMDSLGRGPEGWEVILRHLRDEDVREERPLWKLRMPWIRYFLLHDPIRKLIEKYFGKITALEKPTTIYATREYDACSAAFSIQAADPQRRIEILLASMSIPGVFPPVKFSPLSSPYSDGGTTNYLAIPSDWNTYDEVWLLIANPPYEYEPKEESMLSRLLMNVHISLEHQIREDLGTLLEAAPNCRPRIHVIRPDCGKDAGVLRFDHSLIDEAYKQTKKLLEGESRAHASLVELRRAG